MQSNGLGGGAIIPDMSVERAAGPFQICGSCRRAWPTWDNFVLDPDVRLLGLQSEIAKPDVNLLVFEHSCGSSISILSKRLRHLLPEPEPGDPPARGSWALTNAGAIGSTWRTWRRATRPAAMRGTVS